MAAEPRTVYIGYKFGIIRSRTNLLKDKRQTRDDIEIKGEGCDLMPQQRGLIDPNYILVPGTN